MSCGHGPAAPPETPRHRRRQRASPSAPPHHSTTHLPSAGPNVGGTPDEITRQDAQQVEPLPSGEPTPLQPPSQQLSGDSHAHLIAPTVAFAESLGYTVSFEPIAGSAGGWCDTKAKQIVVDSNGPANARLRTLVHEAIHALGVDYRHYPRAHAEVIVDTTTLIVLGGLGVDVSGETVPYVAGWGENGALDAVTQFAQLIDDLTRRVETALTPPATPNRRPRPDNSTGLARKLAQP
jgi:hypothetical protein